MPGELHKYNGSGKWLKGREDARSAAQIQWKREVAEGGERMPGELHKYNGSGKWLKEERGCQECCTNTMEVGSG